MPYLSPPTLTRDEQRAVLAAVARHPRDHAIISMALGTGLRISEILGLNIGDVFAPNGQPKIRVRIRAEIAKGGRTADVFLPARLVPKLRALWRFKKGRGESLEPDAPVFCSQSRRRLSVRRVQTAWVAWQREAGLDRSYPFHALRHSAITAVYPGPLLGAAVREACEPVDDDRLYASGGRGSRQGGGGAVVLKRATRL
jgi:integrase